MNTITISRVSQLVKYVEEIQSSYCRNQHFLYRGEGILGYSLLPSIYRKNGNGLEVYLSNKSELNILTEFMTDAAGFIDLSPDDMFRWLQYAQHFGTPTRLLDWTSNPLIALYFACSSNQEESGRMYVLNSSGYRMLTNENDINHMEGKLIKDEAIKMILNAELTIPYPSVFKPYYFDQRMLAQSSEFMVWGYKKDPLDVIIKELESTGKAKDFVKTEVRPGIKQNVLEELDILSEIHIIGKDKKTLLRELDWMGINQATVFPGLDGIGRAVEWRNNKNNTR